MDSLQRPTNALGRRPSSGWEPKVLGCGPQTAWRQRPTLPARWPPSLSEHASRQHRMVPSGHRCLLHVSGSTETMSSHREGETWRVWQRHRECLRSGHVPVADRIARLHQIVCASALYGRCLWAPSAAWRRRLDSFELRLLRQMTGAWRGRAEMWIQFCRRRRALISRMYRSSTSRSRHGMGMPPGASSVGGTLGGLAVAVRAAFGRCRAACGSVEAPSTGLAVGRLLWRGLALFGVVLRRVAGCLCQVACMVRRRIAAQEGCGGGRRPRHTACGSPARGGSD